jgi:aryl-alcohol dehydrogenase-like predicted oxidoreductase
MKFIERVDPDAVQPYRNLVDDDYESSGLKAYVDAHDLGVAFFSPLKHGLLLGKYTSPQTFPEGDFRSGVADFRDAAAIARYRQASEEVRARFSDREEPVLSAVTGALLAGNPTATVLLGQRNARQTEAAAKVGEALSESDAAWVRGLYRG